MITTAVSFGGLTFGTNYNVGFVTGTQPGLPPAKVELLERVGAYPVITALTRKPNRLALIIRILDITNVNTLRTSLFRYFDPNDETPKILVVNSTGSVPQYVYALCEELKLYSTPRDQQVFVATLAVHGDSRWRAVTPNTPAAWNVTATGQHVHLMNLGEDDAYPVFSIKPTAVKTGGYKYRRWVPIIWLSGNPGPLYPCTATLNTAALIADSTRHVAINVGGGINDSVVTIPYDGEVGTFPTSGLAYMGTEQFSYTGKSATELTGCTRGVNGTTKAAHAEDVVIYASKMQADGDDLRVLSNGKEVYRWFDTVSWNGAASKIWFNLDFAPGQDGTLKVATDDSTTPTVLELNEDLTTWPAAGIVLIGSEAFVFTGKDTDNNFLTGITRAAKGTSMAVHAIGAAVYWIQHDCWLLYGNATVGAPTVDDRYKPAFELDHSTNASWVYETFGTMSLGSRGSVVEYNAARWLRVGNWFSGTGGCYSDTQRTYSPLGTPYPVIGLWLPILAGVSYYWYLYNPCGITNAVWANGYKRRATTNYSAFGLYQYRGQGWYTNLFQLSAPTNPNAWEAWGYGPSSPAFYADRIAICLYSYPGDMEVGDVTVTLNAAEIPTVAVYAEQATYTIALTLTNSTTVESLTVAFECDLNQTLQIDTYSKTVTYLKDNSSRFSAVTLPMRAQWLRFQPGENIVYFYDTGTTGVTVTVTYVERYY